jgi:protein ERP2
MLLTLIIASSIQAGELTFELPDNEKMCFHEHVQKDIECMLEFQVIEGGNYDVDMTLTTEDNTIIHSVQKQQYDQHTWNPERTGTIQFCFSNEFSTITHKIVYFDFQAGDTDLIPRNLESQAPLTAMTQMETSVMSVYQTLKVIIDYQTHHRLRESQGRTFAEDVNERVQYWSVGQTVIILLAGIGQVMILRSFFTDRKSAHTTAHVRT